MLYMQLLLSEEQEGTKMEPGSFVAVYLPLFTVMMVIIQQRKRRRRIAILQNLKRRGVLTMSVEVFKRNIGRNCQITTMIERKVTGRIIGVEGNWVEIETKGNTEFINAEFMERFRIL